jgi:hypothetical protein
MMKPHMGMYANGKPLDWFVKNYPSHSATKADTDKSCVRFKKPENIPLGLVRELVTKMSVKEWFRCMRQHWEENELLHQRVYA